MNELEQLRRDVEALHGRLNVLEQTRPVAPPPTQAEDLTPLQARVAALEAAPAPVTDDLAELRQLVHAVQAELGRLSQAIDTISVMETRLRGLELKGAT